MTWKPSCKTGSASFSHEIVVPSAQVFTYLFRRVVKEGSKPWKMKKFSIDDFEVCWFLCNMNRIVPVRDGVQWKSGLTLQQKVVGGEIEASVRYCDLVLTSDVTVRWNAEDGTMKISGKYGKAGTGRSALAGGDGEDE